MNQILVLLSRRQAENDKKPFYRKDIVFTPLYERTFFHRYQISRRLKGRRLSDEARLRISAAVSKRKAHENPNWKGGIKTVTDKIRASVDAVRWRKAVLERDSYTCQKTGKKDVKLIAHHIFNFGQHPELRFEISNGITLSKDSHREFHKKYGFKNNSKAQIEEFLGRTV